MRKLVILNIFFLYFLSDCSQKDNCKEFKTGEFEIDSEVGRFIITRYENRQIEYNEQLGLEIEFTIEWINDCSYKLTPVKILQNKKDFNYPMDLILTVEILETSKDSYLQRSSSNISDLVHESRIKRTN